MEMSNGRTDPDELFMNAYGATFCGALCGATWPISIPMYFGTKHVRKRVREIEENEKKERNKEK